MGDVRVRLSGGGGLSHICLDSTSQHSVPTEWTPSLARKWVNSIPPKCPFERQLWWGDRLVLYIPPLCPLNPFSTQLYEIRIEAQTYLSQFKG
jgi:Mo-dependent nitrogenase C-terminus.